MVMVVGVVAYLDNRCACDCYSFDSLGYGCSIIMKLAACFTVYNGLELLGNAITSCFDHVDYVILCYQTTSHQGKQSSSAKEYCDAFLNEPKYMVIEYQNKNVGPKENERQKHQLLIDTAKKLGCTHFYLSATDHFYTPEQFQYAKTEVEKHNYDVTFTNMYTYYKFPEWQLTPIEDYVMPFITKLYPDTKIINSTKFPLRVDPSVRVNTHNKWHRFEESEVMLHHYSMVRSNVRDKLMNAAASFNYDKQEAYAREHDNYDLKENPGIAYFKGRKVKEVPNYFGI